MTLHLVRVVGCSLLLAALAPAEAARLTSEPTGFNDYTWGALSAEYPSLKLAMDPAVAHPLPDMDVYENPGEALTLNGVTFGKIYYRFYKGRLGAFSSRLKGGKIVRNCGSGSKTATARCRHPNANRRT